MFVTIAATAMSEEGLPVPSFLFPTLPPKEGAKLGADNDSYRRSVVVIRAAGERETSLYCMLTLVNKDH